MFLHGVEIFMENPKYVFLIDVDGTLIPKFGNEISIDVFNEIERLKKFGHIFVVSTGRPLQSTIAIKGIEAFQYFSVLLGSCVYKIPEKSLIYKAENMPRDDVDRFIKYLTNKNIEWSYKDEIDEKTIFPNSKFYKKIKYHKIVPAEEYKYDLENNKIMQLLVCDTLTESDRKQFPNFEFYLMPGDYMDVTLKNYSKSRCVEFFKNKYPNMTTVAIGDSANDLPMFEKADISICMGNADEDVKNKATYITKDVNDGGLIHAFRNILKI